MEGRAKRKGELKAGRGVHRSCTPRASAVETACISDHRGATRSAPAPSGSLLTVLSVSLGFKGAHFYAAQTPQKPTASFSVQRKGGSLPELEERLCWASKDCWSLK